MSNDILTLQQFYNSNLGRVFELSITSQIKKFWHNAKKEHVLGIGYCLPYLIHYYHDAESIIYATMAHQGVTAWPPGEDTNCATLVYEDLLPFAGSSFDKILVIHGLEESHSTQKILRELWRVLKENGQLIIITPNRRGLWIQSEQLSLDYNHLYTMSQLSQEMRQTSFTILNKSSFLYHVPNQNHFTKKVSYILQYIGPLLLPQFSGMLCIQATKHVITMSRAYSIAHKDKPIRVDIS
jgi:SAM-dependent methyltransferase